MLEQYMFGVESVAGTPVAADTRLVGEAKIDFALDRKPIIPIDSIGKKVGGYRAVDTTGKLVTGTLSIPRGYFQIMPWLFSSLLAGGITPVEQTTDQEDYLWAFDPDLTGGSNEWVSSTVERGDSEQAFEMEYFTLDRFKVTITLPQDGGDAVAKVEAGFFARQNTKTTFTANITPPTVNEINSLLARLYVDDTGAAIGNTEITDGIRQIEIEILNGAKPEFNGNSLVFTGVEEGDFAVLCTLTLLTGSSAIALYDAIGEKKFVRLMVTGSQIGTGEPHTLDIQFCGAIMEPIPGASKEGVTSLSTIMLEGVFDTTWNALIKVNVTTNVPTI